MLNRYFAILKGAKAKYLTANLDGLYQRALELYSPCILCERKCEVNRPEQVGFCGVRSSRIASMFVHWGEEPELIPSGTIFFSGCNFYCVYCQNWDIARFPQVGEVVDPARVAHWIETAQIQFRWRRADTTSPSNN